MRPVRPNAKPRINTLWLVLSGFACLLAGGFAPAHLKSVAPAVLRQSAIGTPSTLAFADELLRQNQPGPAALVFATTASADKTQPAPALETYAKTHRDLMPWGGWDPFLDPLVQASLPHKTPPAQSTPALDFFLKTETRETARNYLSHSRSNAVQQSLRLRGVSLTGRFVPADQPGGQALDALLLMTALLEQGGRFHPAFQQTLDRLGADALAQNRLGELEPVLLDLLSLGRRLDWVQLSELIGVIPDANTLHEFVSELRSQPDSLAPLYACALINRDAAPLMRYLRDQEGRALPSLQSALAEGTGAVRFLLQRQVRVGASPVFPAPTFLRQLSFRHFAAAIGIKYLVWFAGALFLSCALTRSTPPAAAHRPPKRARLSALITASILTGFLLILTEPGLIFLPPIPKPQLSFAIPSVGLSTDSAKLTFKPATFTMDPSTLLTIGVFAVLQLVMYFACLGKIHQVDRSGLSPLVKLRLMENEENLFDGGLYIGIGGTATALVLQVLGLIAPNLLAAYSSNLFGILCVAFVKIRHVRPFKNQLILDSQSAPTAQAAPQKSA